MRRLVNLAAGAGLAVALTAGFGAAPASALAPSQSGWWTTANAGSSLPGSSPSSPPPDVPADGLLIEGGASSSSGASDSGATAFAAVVYDVLPGATVGDLTLTVAPKSATTPAATLEICPLNNPTIQSEHGGPMSDAPSYSCKQHVTAGPSSSGTTYTFKVSSLVSDSTLAVAILPTSVLDRVVFSAPGANTLEVTGGATPSDPTASGGTMVSSGSTSGDPTATSPSAAGSSLTGSSGTSLAAGSPTSPAASGDPVSAAAPISGGSSSAPSAGTSPALATQTQSSGASTSSPTTAQQGSASSPIDSQFAASTSGSSKANPLAVGLLIAAVLIGGGIWLAVGRAASSAAGETGVEPTPS